MVVGTVAHVAAAALAFAGGHFLLSSAPLRSRLVGRLGDTRFQALYSLFAAATLIWLVASYIAAPFVEVLTPAAWSRHLSLALMPLALILVVAALRKDNPTSGTGDPGAVDFDRMGVFAVTRHPMMWGIALWAGLHLLANGDAASLIFFGAFLVLALGGTVAIDGKKRARRPDAWRALAARTSNVPFLALLQGRARFSRHRLALPTAIGLGVYLLALWLHPWLFGADPLP